MRTRRDRKYLRKASRKFSNLRSATQNKKFKNKKSKRTVKKIGGVPPVEPGPEPTLDKTTIYYGDSVRYGSTDNEVIKKKKFAYNLKKYEKNLKKWENYQNEQARMGQHKDSVGNVVSAKQVAKPTGVAATASSIVRTGLNYATQGRVETLEQKQNRKEELALKQMLVERAKMKLKGRQILTNAYEKREFVTTLYCSLLTLYTDYIDNDKKYTPDGNDVENGGGETKMLLFKSELMLLHKVIKSIETKFLDIIGGAYNGKAEIVDNITGQNVQTVNIKIENSVDINEQKAQDTNKNLDLGTELDGDIEVAQSNVAPKPLECGSIVDVNQYLLLDLVDEKLKRVYKQNVFDETIKKPINREYIFFAIPDNYNKAIDMNPSDKYWYHSEDMDKIIKLEQVIPSGLLKYQIKTDEQFIPTILFGKLSEHPSDSTKSSVKNTDFYFSTTLREITLDGKSTGKFIGEYVTEKNTFFDSFYGNNMEKIIQNQWLLFSVDKDKFYFNTALRIFGTNFGYGDINWIEYVDPFSDKTRYFNPDNRIYGIIDDDYSGKIPGKNVIKYFDDNEGTIFVFNGKDPPTYKKTLVRDRIPSFMSKVISSIGSGIGDAIVKILDIIGVDIPMATLRVVPFVKNNAIFTVKGLANTGPAITNLISWLLTGKNMAKYFDTGHRVQSEGNWSETMPKAQLCNAVSSFPEVKQILQKDINKERLNNHINNVFEKKEIKISTKDKTIICQINQDIQDAMFLKIQYFSRFVLFLNAYSNAINERLTGMGTNGTEDMHRIMDLGFFIMRKGVISEEVKHLFKLSVELPGSAIKLILSGVFNAPGTFISSITGAYNIALNTETQQLKDLTQGKLIKGGAGETGKVITLTTEEYLLNPNRKIYKPSFLSYNLLSGILRSVDCDIREKYVFLTYANNCLQTFQDNIFSDVALNVGKHTLKDTLTWFMMMPYRFFTTNKILGAVFGGFCILGSAVSIASLITPVSPLVVEGFMVGGKVLKIICTPFINMPKEFARTKQEVSNIDHFLKENLDAIVLNKVTKAKDEFLAFLSKEVIVSITADVSTQESTDVSTQESPPTFRTPPTSSVPVSTAQSSGT